jgi:Rnl2 family RNA ligase
VEHVAYPKIPLVADPAGRRVGGPWLATEKIHGAQLVIAFDGRELRVGKRRAWLAAEEPFFGWQLLRPRFRAAAVCAFRGAGTVRLYGELYGGHYPHPDVPPVPGAAPVQTGIWYAPEIRFALFDVLVDDAGYLPYADVARVAGEAGLDGVPVLARGRRSEVDAVPVRYPTRVPGLLGLPPIEGNLAEGVVLRPDAALPPEGRPAVKRKIAEFDERRFDAGRAWDPGIPLTADELRRIAVGMVNAPRVASARSKVGPAGDLAGEVVLDVLIDLTEAFPATMAGLDAAAEARLAAAVHAALG